MNLLLLPFILVFPLINILEIYFHVSEYRATLSILILPVSFQRRWWISQPKLYGLILVFSPHFRGGYDKPYWNPQFTDMLQFCLIFVWYFFRKTLRFRILGSKSLFLLLKLWTDTHCQIPFYSLPLGCEHSPLSANIENC